MVTTKRPVRTMSEQDERRIADAYEGGEPAPSIAKREGCSVWRVMKAIRKLGVKVRPKSWLASLSADEIQVLTTMYRDDKKPGPEVAQYFGVDWGTIYAALRQLGIEIRGEFTRQQSTINHAAFDDVSREEVQYFAGLMLADGCIAIPKKQPNPQVVLVLKASDKALVERFRDFLGSDHKIMIVPPKINKGGRRSSGSVRLAVTSRRLVDKLAEYGIGPRKSLTASFLCGLEHSRHAMRGLLDGDGCITHSEAGPYGLPIASMVGSLATIEQFIAFVKKLCPEFRGTPRPRGKVWVAACSGRIAIALLTHLYSDCAVALERKHVLAVQAINARAIAMHIPVGDDELQEMTDLYAINDLSVAEIAEKFERTPGTVRHNLKKAGVFKKDLRRRPHEQCTARQSKPNPRRDRVMALHNQGLTQAAIAQELGINQSSVSAHIRKAKGIGLPTRPRRRDTWLRVQDLWRAGLKAKEIATELGVSVGTVQAYLREIDAETVQANK